MGIRPVVVEPRFQHYAWGDLEFIPKLYGIRGDNQPYAEAWLGAHKSSPSSARVGDTKVSLDELIATDPERFLGPECHSQFGELPYLVKVLSAARPLSIQVHPSRAQAIAGYRRESAAAIPLDSPHRIYRDKNHKPEVLIALTRFWALCGFRPVTEIARSLDQASGIARILPAYDNTPDWLEHLLTVYFSLPDSEISPALTEWIEGLSRSEADFGPDTRGYWALRCHDLFSRKDRPDRGLLFVLLLNLIILEPWQALFLEAGTPHTHLSGSGIEVMANSDNVLRGGLTPKHIDVGEFLKTLRFESANPIVIRSAERSSEGGNFYRTPAEEFQVERLTIAPGTASSVQTAHGPILLMFLSRQPGARLIVRSQKYTLELSSAGSCMLPHAAEYEFQADSPGEVIRVVVPGHS